MALTLPSGKGCDADYRVRESEAPRWSGALVSVCKGLRRSEPGRSQRPCKAGPPFL